MLVSGYSLGLRGPLLNLGLVSSFLYARLGKKTNGVPDAWIGAITAYRCHVLSLSWVLFPFGNCGGWVEKEEDAPDESR